MKEKIKLTIEMDVTIPQALALQAMFEYWKYLGNIGSSRFVSFYVDGDGNFRPNCKINTSEPIPELTEELAKSAIVVEFDDERAYDFDPIAWKLNPESKKLPQESSKNITEVLQKPELEENEKQPFKTMNDLYKDGSSSEHIVCVKCHGCIRCGDCKACGCEAEEPWEK